MLKKLSDIHQSEKEYLKVCSSQYRHVVLYYFLLIRVITSFSQRWLRFGYSFFRLRRKSQLSVKSYFNYGSKWPNYCKTA